MDKTHKTHKLISMSVQEAELLELLSKVTGKTQSEILRAGIGTILGELKKKGALPKELEDHLVKL
jgi:predicted DNA-binding protein